LEELGELIADRLRRSVGEQLRGRVASHVSGGMDSTAVALLARDCLRDSSGETSVHAVSAVYEKEGIWRARRPTSSVPWRRRD
jgi:asparagine synthase (glutamine-hydrolysing)